MWRPLSRLHHRLASILIIPFLAVLAAPLAAQEIPIWDRGEPLRYERPINLGLEIGKPLVLGLKGGYNFSPRVSGHAGFAALRDFTAITGELRLNLLPFDLARALPYFDAGFTQYFLEVDSRSTTPIAFHSGFGVEYVFLSEFGVAMNLGYQVALGSSEDRSVERYGIHDDVSEWFFALNARYYF